MCVHDGCKKRPTYNIEGETKALYCKDHKLEGMINVVSKNVIFQIFKSVNDD